MTNVEWASASKQRPQSLQMGQHLDGVWFELMLVNACVGLPVGPARVCDDDFLGGIAQLSAPLEEKEPVQ